MKGKGLVEKREHDELQYELDGWHASTTQKI